MADLDKKELFEVEPADNSAPVELKKEDFELVQENVKITDKKLDTKPTTFIKDAFKRFCKNKSSVVGAIILGILILLAIFVPMISQKDIENVHVSEGFLAPKLFEAGTGFWDGTTKHEGIVYDVVEETPAGYKKNAVRDLVVDENPTYLDQASTYGHYGYLMLENENVAKQTSVLLYSKDINFDKDNNYVITIVLGDKEGVQEKQLGEYRISIAMAKATQVKVLDGKIYWKRIAEDDLVWRELKTNFIETKVGKDYIEYRYKGSSTWKQLKDKTVEEYLEGLVDQALTVRYNPVTNAIEYAYYSTEEGIVIDYNELTYEAIYTPEIHNIEVQMSEDGEDIEWRCSEAYAWGVLELGANLDDGSGEKFSNIVLKDFSRDYGTITLNISEILAANSIDEVYGHLCFTLKAGPQRQYILIESIATTTSADIQGIKDAIALKEAELKEKEVAYKEASNADKPAIQAEIDALKSEIELLREPVDFIDYTAFEDATQMVLRKIEAPNYWYCTGRKGVHNTEYYYCSFRYDTYKAVYDNYDDIVTFDELNEYQDKGWLTYNYNRITGEFTYEILSAECPVEKFYTDQVHLNKVTKKLESVGAECRTYAKLGYKRMPKYLFGTNASGNDMFKKAFSGLRTSLVLGVCTAAFCFIFGLIWGSISGYFGGNVDLFMERFCEILSGVPWIVIMTLCILHLGNNFFTFFLALCMTGWMGTAARTRTQFYRFKGREYVLASRTLGASDKRLIFRHILPNSMGTIITGSVLMIPSVIFSESTLAYLNLGLQGVQAFGVMMAENQKYLSLAPNLVVFPAVIIALMMISFNLFGNGLRDAFNPSLKGSE